MIFEKTPIEGCWLIKRNVPIDERGYFSRLIDVKEFEEKDIESTFIQISASKNYHKGTLRGMHMLEETEGENKYITCVDGEVFDVCLDMRKESATYMQYFSTILSEENGNGIYIPKGCAHGFVALRDDSQLIYFMTAMYNPKVEKGFRWNDPAFKIDWPIKPEIISEKDNGWPLV